LVWEALGEYHGPPNFRVFVRYLIAKWDRLMLERSYRAYVTDSLMYAPQMMYLSNRWYDVAYGARSREREKAAEEIVDDIVSRIEGTV